MTIFKKKLLVFVKLYKNAKCWECAQENTLWNVGNVKGWDCAQKNCAMLDMRTGNLWNVGSVHRKEMFGVCTENMWNIGSIHRKA